MRDSSSFSSPFFPKKDWFRQGLFLLWIGVGGVGGGACLCFSQEASPSSSQASSGAEKATKDLSFALSSEQNTEKALENLQSALREALGPSSSSRVGQAGKKEVSEESHVFKVDVEVLLPGAPHSGTREDALLQGRRLGFVKLWSRLSVNGTVPSLIDQDLKNLIEQTSVVQEKITSQSYKGIFRFHFKGEKVRDLLKQKKISYSEIPSQPILVLPLYKIGDHSLVFEEENSWRSAWKTLLEERKKEGSLLKFTLVSPETNPPSLDSLSNQDMEKVVTYLEKEKAGYLMLSQMTLTNPEGSVLELKLNQLTIDTEGHINRSNPIVYRSAQSPLGDILKKALTVLAQDLDLQWKKGTVLKEEQRETQAKVFIQDLEDWHVIAEKLKEMTLIRQYQFRSLRPHQIEISIAHGGDVSQLIQGLKGYGLWAAEEGGMVTLSLKKQERSL